MMMMIVTCYNNIRVGFSEEKEKERKKMKAKWIESYVWEKRASDLERKKEKQKGEGEGRGTYENFACDQNYHVVCSVSLDVDWGDFVFGGSVGD